MKSVLSIILASFFMFAFTVPAEVEVTPISKTKSEITWQGYKVTGKHNGSVALKEGAFEYENGMLTGGEIWIDMTSIKVLDLQGDMAGKLEGHLKSSDFFGVENYPSAHFKITEVISRGTPGEYKVVGDLTIKENTKEIKFNAKVSEEAGTMVAVADITIDRSDFDVRYGSGSFFDNLGDKTIYDEFDMSLKLVTE